MTHHEIIEELREIIKTLDDWSMDESVHRKWSDVSKNISVPLLKVVHKLEMETP